jgi:hypothetical protein
MFNNIVKVERKCYQEDVKNKNIEINQTLSPKKSSGSYAD